MRGLEMSKFTDTLLNEKKIEELSNRVGEGEPFKNFLRYVKRTVLPSEEEEMRDKRVPEEEFDAEGTFIKLLRRVEREGWINLLSGTFWERQFCSMVSDWRYYTFWGQRHILYGTFRAGRTQTLENGREKVDPDDYISLPDILIFGNGWVGFCAIKHDIPRSAYKDFSIKKGEKEDWLRLVNLCPHIPVLYVFYNYGVKKEDWTRGWSESEEWREKLPRRRWGVINDPGNWIAAELSKVKEFDSRWIDPLYISLDEFRPLQEVLTELSERAKTLCGGNNAPQS
jgi:hypothetical protein